MNVIPSPGFEVPPYRVEVFPAGAAVVNANDFNCLHFPDAPGGKFTTPENAARIAAAWNDADLAAQAPHSVCIGASITEGVLHVAVQQRGPGKTVRLLGTARMDLELLKKQDCIVGMTQPDRQLLDDYATEIKRLRNVIQAACLGGTDMMIERWKALFPDAPVPTVKTQHVLFKTGDADAPAQILDRNGEAHDDGAATRLRGICGDLGLGAAIPETNERLMALQFSVFGMIRRALGKAQQVRGVPESDRNDPVPAPTDRHPDQPLRMVQGVQRFKANAIVRHLLDAGGIGMNQLAARDFSDEDRQQFAQLIGYSLSGYGGLSYVSDEAYGRAANQQAARALLSEFDVRKIMLDVVPGWDGEGVEVYAKSAREVEALLTKMSVRIEELEGRAQQAQGVPTGFVLVKKSRLDAIKGLAVDPSAPCYEGRGLYDDSRVRANWSLCVSRLDDIHSELMSATELGHDADDLEEALLAAAPQAEPRNDAKAAIAMAMSYATGEVPAWVDEVNAAPQAEPQTSDGDTLEDNVKFLLDRCPYTVRVREGGGPESLTGSLCTTFIGMQARLQGDPLFAPKKAEPQPEREPLTDEQMQRVRAVLTEASNNPGKPFTLPADAVASLKAFCGIGTKGVAKP